jgi:amidase
MDICDLSALELSRAIAARRLAPSEVMAATLARIAARNPGLNAVVSLRDPEALMAEARALDDAPPRGWLHGVPFAVKDLVATAGLRTTWGSPLHADHVPAADDLVAARLRAAGAVFVGKTNVPEWGQGSNTYNPVFGATRNPYDPARTPGGSSGGAAAALAARMLAVADGSDMMGSLRNPAAFCNVYGFRPSFGLVPADAAGDTFSATLATEGPMARTVADLARLLLTLAGENPGTPFARAVPAPAPEGDIGGARIGWLADWGGAWPVEPGILDLCRRALAVFEGLGCVVEEVPPPFPAGDLWQAWTTLRAWLNAGAKAALWQDPAARAATKPETLWEIETGLRLTAGEVYRASETRSRWYACAAGLFDRYDALVLPGAQVWPFAVETAWPRQVAGVEMDTYHRWMEVMVPVSLAGLPCLACPAGFGAGGLPMGFQIFGRAGADMAVLRLGQAYHAATDWPGRVPPPPAPAAG